MLILYTKPTNTELTQLKGPHLKQSPRSLPSPLHLQRCTNSQQLIRNGNHTVADLMSIGATMLGRRHVLPSVTTTLTEIMVEGTFPTGTYLVTVHHPISSDDGNLAKALYGSFLPIPDPSIFELPEPDDYEATKMPGALVTAKGKVVLNEGRKRIKLKVTSKGDRPIQVSLQQKLGRFAVNSIDWISLPLH